MPVEPYVEPFQDGGYIAANGTKLVFQVLGEPYPAGGMSCHNATFLWLWRATHGGALPPAETMMVPGVTQTFVNALVLRGHPSRVTEQSAPEPADVLIFTKPESTQADHSCIAIRGGTIIAGYNQLDWFEGGRSHDFSAHHVSRIEWEKRKLGARRRPVINGTGRYLWAVREGTAMGLMRELHP